jgi:hypothetical protein
MGYKVKVKKISVVNESGDRVVVLNCYLADSAGVAVKSLDGGAIGFDVRAPNSSIPEPMTPTYLDDLVKAQIAVKYNRYLLATVVPVHGSKKLSFSSSDIEKLFIGLVVTGPGIASSATVASITSPTEIQLSSSLALQLVGSTTSPSFTLSGSTVLDSTTVTVSSTANIVNGMNISGTGIPYGSIVTSVATGTTVIINQKATATGSATYTFSTVSDSVYLNATSSYFNSLLYEDLTISGPSTIPRDTTILEVISATKIKLSNNATGTASSQTCTISGYPTYYFDAASLTLDLSEVEEIVNEPIINFSNL